MCVTVFASFTYLLTYTYKYKNELFNKGKLDNSAIKAAKKLHKIMARVCSEVKQPARPGTRSSARSASRARPTGRQRCRAPGRHKTMLALEEGAGGTLAGACWKY